MQNEITNVEYIVDQAHRKGMCIILNPSPFDRNIAEMDFNKLSYIVLNEFEAEEISGKAIPQESISYIKSKYPNLKIVLTLGSNGSIYSDTNAKIYQAAFEVDTVDTTAAGDTFMGYFAAELARGTDYAQILKISSAASALAVSKKGAVPSIPGKNDVMCALKTLRKMPNNLKAD